jgi:hypothetical protein
MLSAHADVFGVGITPVVGSMLVSASTATGGWIVPGGGLLGTSGVESGKAAPLVGGPPGIVLHTVVDGLPSEDTADTVPVVLPTNGVGIVPNAIPGIIVVDDIVPVDGIIVAMLPAMDVEAVVGTIDGVGAVGVAATAGAAAVAVTDDATGIVVPKKSVANDVAGVADNNSGAVELAVVAARDAPVRAGVVAAAGVEGVVPIAPPVAEMEITGTGGVPGAICPVGAAQVTTVPGVVGSEASGTGASVVPGEFGWVVAENGLGP